MGNGTKGGFPAALVRGQRKIEQWRQRRRPRARLPEALWRQAAELACAYGINRTARALRLDYYSLKKRVAAAAGDGQRTAERPADGQRAPEFLEILPAASVAARLECGIELEDAGGVKMRIDLQGGDLPDVAALVRAFREGRS